MAKSFNFLDVLYNTLKYKYRDDLEVINEVMSVGNDDVMEGRKFEVYSFKFPDNSIYVGYTSHGLENAYKNHSRCSLSPIYKTIKEYPGVYPEVELTVENVSFNELNKLQRKVFDSNLNMKILNENLWLYGY